MLELVCVDKQLVDKSTGAQKELTLVVEQTHEVGPLQQRCCCGRLEGE